MEGPAKAAVGVGVTGQRRDRRLRLAVAEEEVEAATLDEPRLSVQELGCLLEIDHGPRLPYLAPASLEDFRRSEDGCERPYRRRRWGPEA